MKLMTMTIRPLLLTRYCSTNQSAKSQLTHHTLFGEFKSCSTISFSSSYCCGGAMTVCNLPIVYQKTPHHNKSTTENSIQLLSTSSFFNPTTPAANTATNTTDIRHREGSIDERPCAWGRYIYSWCNNHSIR
mmetsp:Transcript_55584/g.82650  ORF Transcript_55584/g.82650 Transcript_55584/m.82650 type:complete len:132 (-) Transcript_55584:15-410(-)